MASERLNEADRTRLNTLKAISDKYAEIAINAKRATE